MPRKHRFIGWAVMAEHLPTGRVRMVHRCNDQEQARQEVRQANLTFGAELLFFVEFWSTSSVLDQERSEVGTVGK